MNSHPQSLIHFCQQYPAIIISDTPEQILIAVSIIPPRQQQERLCLDCRRPVKFERWSETQLQNRRLWMSDNTAIAQPLIYRQPQLSERQPLSSIPNRAEQLLLLAAQRQASDIHLQPAANGLQIRFRINGLLQTDTLLSHEEGQCLVTHFKILAEIDIAESRLPQDGQFSFKNNQQILYFRLATLLTRYGEKIVLRLLKPWAMEHGLADPGLTPQQLRLLQNSLNAPQGLILVTGPTGSGKTMTLYRALQYLNDSTRNLCSAEDPIEMILEGVNQSQINHKTGLTFQRALAAILRQDPDVIMIGEIRDMQSADIAIKAALSGHLVLSTLHANSTVETIIRLLQMQIAPYLITCSVRLIIAQRLVRKLCSVCKKPADPLQGLNLVKEEVLCHWQATGCSHCRQGYDQRLALFECLLMTTSLQSAILSHATLQQLITLSQQQKMTTLWQSGIRAVQQGLTTWSELLRIMGAPDELR